MMSFDASHLRLFGLDLGRAVNAFRQGWEGALRWPAFAWLSPAQPVLVRWPDGAHRILCGTTPTPVDAGEAGHAPRFQALVLPSDIVLTHTTALPHLLDSEIRQALELQAQSLSPFAAGDFVWGWRIDDITDAGLRITLVVASCAHVAAYLTAQGSRADAGPFEVWAEANGMVVLNGFGEEARRRKMRTERSIVLGLLTLATLLVLALGNSPVARIQAQARDAERQLARLEAKVAGVMDERNALALARDRTQAVGAFLDGHVNVAALLEELSEMLPDTAWITRIEVDGRRVRISGYAADAAGLMELLRSQRTFASLSALSPIARARNGQESFNLQFDVVPRAAGTP